MCWSIGCKIIDILFCRICQQILMKYSLLFSIPGQIYAAPLHSLYKMIMYIWYNEKCPKRCGILPYWVWKCNLFIMDLTLNFIYMYLYSWIWIFWAISLDVKIPTSHEIVLIWNILRVSCCHEEVKAWNSYFTYYVKPSWIYPHLNIGDNTSGHSYIALVSVAA